MDNDGRQIQKFSLEGGKTVWIEVSQPVGVEQQAGKGMERVAFKPAENAAKSFQEALATVKPVASAMIGELRNLDAPADEVEVKFGLQFTADAQAFVASIGSGVNFEITLKWQKE